MSREAVETARGSWRPPGPQEIREIMAAARTVAVVGASPRPDRPSNGVTAYLLAATGWTVWPVTPRAEEVLGVAAFPSLADLPGRPDIVDVFRRVEALPEVARAAVAVGAGTLWLQLGLHNDEAVRIAHEAGLRVVTDRCLKVEHARLVRGARAPAGGV